MWPSPSLVSPPAWMHTHTYVDFMLNSVNSSRTDGTNTLFSRPRGDERVTLDMVMVGADVNRDAPRRLRHHTLRAPTDFRAC